MMHTFLLGLGLRLSDKYTIVGHDLQLNVDLDTTLDHLVMEGA